MTYLDEIANNVRYVLRQAVLFLAGGEARDWCITARARREPGASLAQPAYEYWHLTAMRIASEWVAGLDDYNKLYYRWEPGGVQDLAIRQFSDQEQLAAYLGGIAELNSREESGFSEAQQYVDAQEIAISELIEQLIEEILLAYRTWENAKGNRLFPESAQPEPGDKERVKRARFAPYSVEASYGPKARPRPRRVRLTQTKTKDGVAGALSSMDRRIIDAHNKQALKDLHPENQREPGPAETKVNFVIYRIPVEDGGGPSRKEPLLVIGECEKIDRKLFKHWEYVYGGSLSTPKRGAKGVGNLSRLLRGESRRGEVVVECAHDAYRTVSTLLEGLTEKSVRHGQPLSS